MASFMAAKPQSVREHTIGCFVWHIMYMHIINVKVHNSIQIYSISNVLSLTLAVLIANN